MGIYGMGQAYNVRAFWGGGFTGFSRPMLPPMHPPMAMSYTTTVNYNYRGPSPLLWFGLGALKGYADYSQQKQYMKLQEQQMQQQTALAKSTQEATTLQSMRPKWKITQLPGGSYIATKLDKDGNVIDEVEGDFNTVRQKTKDTLQA